MDTSNNQATKAQEAEEAGAEFVGAEEMAEKIKNENSEILSKQTQNVRIKFIEAWAYLNLQGNFQLMNF